MPKLPSEVRRVERGGRVTYHYRRTFTVRVNGRKDRKDIRKRFSDYGELQAFLRTVEEEIRKEGRPRIVTPTVADFAEHWLERIVRKGRNGKGLALARQRMRDHVLPVLGDLRLADVSVDDLTTLRDAVEAKGLAPQTAKHIMGDVRHLLRHGQIAGHLQATPFFHEVHLPRVEWALPKPLRPEQLEAILGALAPEYAFAVRLGCLTGLRHGELHRLRWDQVVRGDRAHLEIVRTKSRRPRRVPLLPGAIALLAEERARTSSVFVLPYRARQATTWVQRTWPRVGRWHFHQTRHTFATDWLSSGGAIVALSEILGHGSVTTTERYAARLSSFVEAQVEAVGRKWAGAAIGNDVANRVAMGN